MDTTYNQRQKKRHRSLQAKVKKSKGQGKDVRDSEHADKANEVIPESKNDSAATSTEVQEHAGGSRSHKNGIVDAIQTTAAEDKHMSNTVEELSVSESSSQEKKRRKRRRAHESAKAGTEASEVKLGSPESIHHKGEPLPPKEGKLGLQEQELVSQKLITKDDQNSPIDREKQEKVKKQRKKKKAHKQKPNSDYSNENNKQSVVKATENGERTRKQQTHQWTMSSPSGGMFIDHDPVLTLDEQFLILATDRSIHIYATKTSLLVRTLEISKKSTIVSYAQMPDNDQFLVVGLKNGSLFKYDWSTGRKVWHFQMTEALRSLIPTSSGPEGDSLLIVQSSTSGEHVLSSLTLSSDGKETGRKLMLSKKNLKTGVRFSAQLGVVVVCTNDSAFIGQLHQTDESGESLQWHQISTPSDITCFDAQILHPSTTVSKSKKKILLPIVHLALGIKSGEIQVYNDVLNKNGNLSGSSSQNLHARRLHWHRVAPRSVKFSPDSSYLISGGDETVLVIWQLDTNQKQVLPHLTTPILNMSISHQGSAYALRLADNSVMVLSTADLQPFANVNGLAFDTLSRTIVQPAALHPNHSDRLFIPYSSQSLNPDKSPPYKSSTMLQTYDIAGQIQLSRQALARNLVSTVNVAPNGQPLQEPDVTHLDISHDGKWLITVDQWAPNDKDLDEMYLSRGDRQSRTQESECYLRFWASSSIDTVASSEADGWELNTRIDESVAENEWSDNGRKILAIATSPTRHQLAVADSNHHVKIYSPKARMRSGVPVRDGNGQQLFTWTCDHQLPFTDDVSSSKLQHATLAFSEDGSVLAVSWAADSDTRARVHLVESKTGIVAASLPDMISAGRSTLAFSEQYLLGLSTRLCIFDTVTMQQTSNLSLADRFDQSHSMMAVDGRNGVVAVAVAINGKDQVSQLELYDLKSEGQKRIYKVRIPARVRVLLADKARGGFVIVDGDGQTMRVSGPGSGSMALVGGDATVEPTMVRNSLENVFGTGRKQLTATVVPPVQDSIEESQQKTIEDIFRFETTSQAPTPKDLFNQVARIVASVSA